MFKPYVLIATRDDELILYGRDRIKVKDIKNIDYRRSRTKGRRYSFGRIIISLRNGKTIRIRHVASVKSLEANLEKRKLKK